MRPPLARYLRGRASPPAGRGGASDAGVPRQPRSVHAARASLSFSSVATGSALTRFCTAGEGVDEAGFPKMRENIARDDQLPRTAPRHCLTRTVDTQLSLTCDASRWRVPTGSGKAPLALRGGAIEQNATLRGAAVQLVSQPHQLPRAPAMASPLGVASPPVAPGDTGPWARTPARRPRCGLCASTGRPHHQPGDGNPPSAAPQPRLADFAAAFAALTQQAGGGAQQAPRLPSLSDSAGALCDGG